MIRILRGGDGDAVDAAGLEDLYAHDPTVVRGNVVLAIDGAVEFGGRSGALGGPADKEVFATLRAMADVVVVGASTARSEDYGPAWLAEERRSRRLERAQPELPSIAVVTRSADLDPAGRLFVERRASQPSPPRPLVLTCEAAPAERRAALAEVADVVVLGGANVDLGLAVDALRAAGLARVLCEGGPTLLCGLIAAGLLDELCVTHAPLLAGPGRLTLSGSTGPKLDAPSRFRLVHVLEGEGQLLARYVASRGGDQ